MAPESVGIPDSPPHVHPGAEVAELAWRYNLQILLTKPRHVLQAVHQTTRVFLQAAP